MLTTHECTTGSTPVKAGESVNLAAALDLARAGFPIFPCKPDKSPFLGDGFKGAVTDIAQIERWWAQWPNALIGLPTGTASGLWVLDGDMDADKGVDGFEELRRLDAEHGELPIDVCAHTPRGGTHVFFRMPVDIDIRNSQSKIARGLDVRASGGYVIVASRLPDGRAYHWANGGLGKADLPDAPEWLVEMATRKGPPSQPMPKQDLQPNEGANGPTPAHPVTGDPLADRKRAYALAALDREVADLAGAPEGTRNGQLNIAAHSLGIYVGAGALQEGEVRSALTQAAATCGLTPYETRKTLASGLECGKEKPASFPPEWEAEQADLERLRALNGGICSSSPAPSVSWDTPDLSALRTARRAPPPFNPEWLGPALARWCGEQAAATCAPADYVGCTLLGLVGGILANRRRPQAGAGWNEPPTLFVATVGDPSSGKSPASSAVMGLVEPEEAHFMATYRERMAAYQNEKASADAVLAAHKVAVRGAMKANPELEQAIPTKLPEDFREPIKPVLQRVVVRDATTEKLMALAGENEKGLVLHRDELAGLFASFGRYSGGGGSDRQFLLECYGGRSFTVDRVKNDEPVLIPFLSIGIIGALQPDKAAELLKGADDGFVSRFLWCWPDPVQGFHISRERFDRRIAEQLVSRLVHLGMQANPPPQPNSPELVPLDESALHELEQFALEMKGREGKASPLMKSALGKARGHVMRLSCILQYIWWGTSRADPFNEPMEIGGAAVATACEMMRTYFLPMAERVFGGAAIPLAEANATILARYLKQERKGMVNAREARRKIGGSLRDGDAMDAALEELMDACLVRPTSQPLRSRRARDFEVNPMLIGKPDGPTSS